MKKSCFVVTTTPLLTIIPDQLKRDVSWVLLQQNEKQAFIEGKDAEGSPLPDGVDLVESSNLKSSYTHNAEGYGWDESYAEFVDRRYHFAGLSDSSLDEAMPEVQRLFDEAGDALIAEGE